ncbi:LTA synthase family protein, partial [Streptococcus suis]
EHLLGIKSDNYLQVGQDILSSQHSQKVALLTAGSFITPKYTSSEGKIYYTDTGLDIPNPDETPRTELEARKAATAAPLA